MPQLNMLNTSSQQLQSILSIYLNAHLLQRESIERESSCPLKNCTKPSIDEICANLLCTND